MNDLTARAREYHALVGDDSAFQRRARLLQSIWRVERGYPIGYHQGRQLGSRLAMPWAEETLANYLTNTVRDVVREEVLDADKSKGKLYKKPRIFEDLLSSQPLCFNLFGELRQDLQLASAVIEALTAGRVKQITAIDFEHSPGRGDPRFTGDHSAFDVYMEYRTAVGGPGFLGVEVKYHEDLGNAVSDHHCRYDEVAEVMGCFRPDHTQQLRTKPLQQIWRDHLLAGSLLHSGDFEDGLFVLLYPAGNDPCARAALNYRDCLSSTRTFADWTLETVTATIKRLSGATWIDQFIDRYLGFGKLMKLSPCST